MLGALVLALAAVDARPGPFLRGHLDAVKIFGAVTGFVRVQEKILVVIAQGLGDIDLFRAGQAIAAGRATHLDPLPEHLLDPVEGLRLPGAQVPGRGGDVQILLHLDHFGHAAQHHAQFGLVPQPPQAPVGQGPVRPGFGQNPAHILGHILNQKPAAQRFHDHDPQAPVGGQPHPLPPGLVIFIQVVILDLGEIPVPRQGDFLEQVIGVVEGEAGVFYAAVLDGFGHEVPKFQFLHPGPDGTVEIVSQVEVDSAHLQAFELEVEEFVQVRPAFRQPGGQFGGQADLVPVAAFQGLGHEGFAGPGGRAVGAVVGPGRIDIVDALVNGPAQHGRGQIQINAGRIVLIRQRQPHATEAQDRQFQTGSAENFFPHLYPAPLIPRIIAFWRRMEVLYNTGPEKQDRWAGPL